MRNVKRLIKNQFILKYLHCLHYGYLYSCNLLFRTLALLFGTKLPEYEKILIISPHPDDEILGCGGLMANMVEENKKVLLVLLTKGENSHFDSPFISKDLLKEERVKLTQKAASKIKLPIENITFLDFKDGNINDKDSEIIKLELLINSIKPDAVFVPYHFEGNKDHETTSIIVKSITKNTPIHLIEYCVWFWRTLPLREVFKIEWKNASIFKIGKTANIKKNDAISIYLEAKDSQGIYYSGKLPKILIKSGQWRNEIYFKNN